MGMMMPAGDDGSQPPMGAISFGGGVNADGSDGGDGAAWPAATADQSGFMPNMMLGMAAVPFVTGSVADGGGDAANLNGYGAYAANGGDSGMANIAGDDGSNIPMELVL